MNAASPQDLQPFLATEVMAFVLGVLALVHLALWRRDLERGLGWLAAGMGLMALMAATDPFHRPSGVHLPGSPWALLLVAALMCLAVGLVDYLAVPPGLRRRALWATLLPPAVYAVLVLIVALTDARIPRSVGQLPPALSFLSMGVLAWWASRRERGAGHLFIAASLLAIPLIAVAITAARADTLSLRLFAFGPLLVLGLGLIPVSLLRRRRALQAEVARRSAAEAELTRLNASLETTVAERTGHLQELVEGLESFNRSVSHDLRGSLGGIAGAARLAADALERGNPEFASRVLPAIADQAENGTRLMAALLALARVGDTPLQYTSIDLHRLIGQVVDQVAREHDGGRLPQIDVAREMPAVRGDAELVKAVLANLIGNAVKFTREVEAGRIEIGAETSADGVTVHVRDNGAGFDAAAAARLFTPFTRLHGATFGGHGVGLSIVRRAVERHGGRVWAEGRPGQGAVFRFSLPAVR